MHVSKDAADGCHASPQQPQDYSAVLDALHQSVQRPPLPLCEVPPFGVPFRPCTCIDAHISAGCPMQTEQGTLPGRKCGQAGKGSRWARG